MCASGFREKSCIELQHIELYIDAQYPTFPKFHFEIDVIGGQHRFDMCRCITF